MSAAEHVRLCTAKYARWRRESTLTHSVTPESTLLDRLLFSSPGPSANRIPGALRERIAPLRSRGPIDIPYADTAVI